MIRMPKENEVEGKLSADSRMDPFLKNAEIMISRYIKKETIRLGWDYYDRMRVGMLRHIGSRLAAVVKGEHEYHVVLGGSDSESSCTCPVAGPCKHMAALYFKALGEQGGRPERALERLTGAGPVIVSRMQASSPKVLTEIATPVSDPGMPEWDAPPQQWLNWMEERYGDTWNGCKHSLHPLQPVLSALKGSARDWRKPLQRLHWMASILFVLEQAERAIVSLTRSAAIIRR